MNTIFSMYEKKTAAERVFSGSILYAAALLLFLCLFIPFSFPMRPVKAGLLGILLVAAVVSMFLKRRVHLAPEVLLLFLFFIAVGSVYDFFGAVRGNFNSLAEFRLYVIWPAVYLLLVTLMTRKKHFRVLLATLVTAAAAVSAYGILYVLTSLGVLPGFLFIDLQGTSAIQTTAIGFHEGFVEYRLLSVTGMPFLIPFLMAAVVTWPPQVSPVPRWFLWLALVLSLVAMIFTCRRALFLVVALSPLIILSLQAFVSGGYAPAVRRYRCTAIILGILLLPAIAGVINTVYKIDPAVIVQDIRSAFNPEEDKGARVRFRQMRIFGREIAERPFLGSGLGASIAQLSRKPERQQSTYELMYFTLVFHVGIAGFLIYFSGIGWIYFRAVSMLRSGEETGVLALPVFAGSAAFLIANATNPYIASFEFMWTIFLPVAAINLYLLQKGKERCQ